jgi:hypothetical protein
MIVSGVSLEDLEAARDVASQVLGNELVFSELHSYSPTWHGIRLKVENMNLPGARRHSHMFAMGYAPHPRRSRFACSHAYGHLLVAVFERNPEARIHTAMADYEGFRDFLHKYPDVLDRNTGSQMLRIRYGDECSCPSDEIPTDTLEVFMWRPVGVIPELPSPANTQVQTTDGGK